MALGLSALGMATGFVTNMFEVVLISISAYVGVAWLASRKAAREKSEEEARKDAEKREFIRRLRVVEASPGADPTSEREVPGPAMSDRFGGLSRLLESWPGAVIVAGAGLVAALYAGVIAVDFLPNLAKYVAIAVPSLVLPAVGRDWLAGRLTGASSPRGILGRISPLMTMAVPAVAFVFTGILFGRAKGAADEGLSSSRRVAVALAGPAVNVALALVGAAAAAGLAWVGASDVLVSLVSTFIIVNVMTALLDLLPAYPLAGHHVVRHLVGHVFAAPRVAAWLDRHPGLQLAILAVVLFIGGGLLNDTVLQIFGALYWPAAWASVP